MLRVASGDRPPPRRVFLSHTSELRRFPAGRSFVAAVESAVSRSGDAVTDMANVHVLIAGFRYGSPVRDRPDVSYTELEYQTAGEAGITRLIFLLREGAEGPAGLFRDPRFGARQEGFRERLLAADRVADKVTSPDGLETALLHALTMLPRARSAGSRWGGCGISLRVLEGSLAGLDCWLGCGRRCWAVGLRRCIPCTGSGGRQDYDRDRVCPPLSRGLRHRMVGER